MSGEFDGRIYSASEGNATVRGRGQAQGQDQNVWGQEQSFLHAGQGFGQRFQGNKAWWSVGEYLHQGLTHKSVGLSLGQGEEETWELSDSLADLYQAVTQRQLKEAAKLKGHTRRGSLGGRADGEGRNMDMSRWMDEDTSHGFIYVYMSESENNARLFPCTLTTSAQKICLQLGIPGNSLHVQLNGDVIRRMEPFDCPLAIQNEYLAGLGYSDVRYIQEEGLNENLAFLVRFYAGKPLSDSTYSRNQLSTYAYVRKGRLLYQWARRLCVISGTRLLIYREKGAEPTVIQLARGSVEEVHSKSQSFVLKLTSTYQGERSLYLSFMKQEDYDKWLRKIKKATAKLPSKADLSGCHLEFIPETVFINTELQILNLHHNALRERPIEEDIYTIGWLDDLPRFTALRSLNLANNHLMTFPLSLCNIRSLMELNLASNKLEEVPPQISELVNLQVFHLHNNLLTSLPDEIAHMKSLTVIVLAFNRFSSIPPVLLQSQNAVFLVDSLIMAGNQISRLPADMLVHTSHIKKIDLRLNKLQLLPTETAKFRCLEHITHVDIRENFVTDLDIRALRCLEYLNCDRNSLKSLQLNGSSLKTAYASHNCLQTLTINPKPEWLVTINVSHNKLTGLPAWLPDCFFLVHLDVSHNLLKALPDRLFADTKKLKIVKANHNCLTSLPEKIRSDTLEELHLQHNAIRQLSVELFIKAHRLRYLNMTRNKLCDLPPPNKNDSYNKLQELYLSFNHLANRCLHKICCFPRLRVLHLAKNKITAIEEMDIEKLEQLMELNVSSNNLTYLPAVLGRHPKLQVLRANCNLLQNLPNFKNSSGLKVLEVSSNHLVNVNMSNLMASQMTVLDISANPNILVKAHDIDVAKNSNKLCMVDRRGQNWSLEDISPNAPTDDEQLWRTGLSQTSGIRNKLSVTAINKPHFNDRGEALFAIFDGGRNDAVASALCDIIPDVLREERHRNKNPYVYLKYCFLSAHRNLKTQGQKLGAAAAVTHLYKDEKGQHVLSVGNVGDSQVVLCRQKRAYLLSRPLYLAEDSEDKKRVVNSGGIITEDGRVSGVTYNSRLLGCTYLYPQVIPDPHVTCTTLTSDDTFFIVASHGLWQYVTYEEAIHEIIDIPDPVVAAKRLQDLAQGYGSQENIAVLVVRLMLSEAERSRIKEVMREQRSGQKELIKILSQQGNLLELRDGVPKNEELSDVVIKKSGHARKHRTGHKHLPDNQSVGSFTSSEVSGISGDIPETLPHTGGGLHFQVETVSPERIKKHKKLRKERSDGDAQQNQEKHLYRKKLPLSSHTSLDTAMKKRAEIIYLDQQHVMKDNSENKLINKEELSGQVEENNCDEQFHLELFGLDLDEDSSRNLVKLPGDEFIGQHYTDVLNSSHENICDGDEDMFVSSAECADLDIEPMENPALFLGNNLHENPEPHNDSFNRISPSENLSVSPCESVSSIDFRVNQELQDVYNLRYNSTQNQIIEAVSHARISESDFSNKNEFHTRSLSPDSIISQNEFVKPPVNFANIDRDAVLFHQMQMARVQAQSSSNASLDSVQSAPMHASNKNIYPNVRASSHSIEVLVNFNESAPRGGSMKGGRVRVGSSPSANLQGAGINYNLQGINPESGSGSHSYAGSAVKKMVAVETHTLPNETKSGSDITGDGFDESDNDTLIGDAEDLAQFGSDEFDDHISRMSGNKNHQDILLSPKIGRMQGLRRHEDEASDSDSDESLGDISLGDGYAAVQFSRIDRQSSMSMMNVLESESEDYPELYLARKGFPMTTAKLAHKGSHFVKTSKSENAQPRKVMLYESVDENNDYETIDDDDKIKTPNTKTIDEFKDDINPYEIVDLPSHERNYKEPSPSIRQPKVSSEEDIDALYAKVNKMKMDKLKDRNDSEGMRDHLDTFLPILLSSNDHSRQKIYGKYKPDSPYTKIETKNLDGNDLLGGGKHEIFTSSSNFQPQLLDTSNRSISNATNFSPYRTFNTDQTALQFTNSSPTTRRSPSTISGSHVLPNSQLPHTSSHSIQKCNIYEIESDKVLSQMRSSPTYSGHKSVTHSSTSIKSDPLLHMSSGVPPPVPPKLPYQRTQDSALSGNAVKPHISPRTSLSQKSLLPNSQPVSRLQYSQPIPRRRCAADQSDSKFQGINQSLLSSHGQVSPQSYSLHFASGDASDSAGKLSSQKSILITYL